MQSLRPSAAWLKLCIQWGCEASNKTHAAAETTMRENTTKKIKLQNYILTLLFGVQPF